MINNDQTFGAVFFDRDGVLNEDIGYVSTPEMFRWVDGARDALRLVQQAGLLTIIVTNQSGVARGYYSEADVEALHAWMRNDLARDGIGITAIYTCPYHESAIDEAYAMADHPDRKPNPGMILAAIADWNIDPVRAFIVGDKPSDIEAGRRAGIAGVLYQGGNLAKVIAPHLVMANRPLVRTDLVPPVGNGADQSGQFDAIPSRFAEAVRNYRAIDLHLPGFKPEDGDHFDTIVVEIDVAAPDPLTSLIGAHDFLMLRDVLQHVADYRTLLRTAFARLTIGGQLLISVPHQFLRERKFRRPSRHSNGGMRFYTPASLLLEVQEALDPTEFRVRHLADDDRGYDYEAPVDTLARGNKHIALVIERIARPGWADAMEVTDDPCKPADRPGNVLTVNGEDPVRQIVIEPSPAAVFSILVLKLDHRGDFMLSVDALRELRALYPAARIVLACGSWNVSSARATGLLDEVLSFNLVVEDVSTDEQGLSADAAEAIFSGLIAGRTFTLAIDLSFHDQSRQLLRCIEAEHKAGFDRWNTFPFLDIKLSPPIPSEDGRALQGFMAPERFGTRMGIHKVYAIDVQLENASIETGECLLYGPYDDLGPGAYVFDFCFDGHGMAQQVGYDICVNNGTKTLCSGVIDITQRHLPQAWINIDEPASGIEIRLFVNNPGPLNFRFMGVRYRREGMIIGIHQLEAMHLLVHLANARLRQPYRIQEFPA